MVNELMFSIHFVMMGILGGIARLFIQAKSKEDLVEFSNIRILVLGPIAGVVYYNMHVSWGVPDSVICFFFSYAFIDIVERLAEIIKSKIQKFFT